MISGQMIQDCETELESFSPKWTEGTMKPNSEKAHSPLPCDMESILIAAGISKADAQYACVAVNLHSQLVEALEKIEKVTGDFTRDGKYLGDQRCLWIYEVAKEALRSAKGIERE
jgi:hypothetical protein